MLTVSAFAVVVTGICAAISGLLPLVEEVSGCEEREEGVCISEEVMWLAEKVAGMAKEVLEWPDVVLLASVYTFVVVDTKLTVVNGSAGLLKEIVDPSCGKH